MVFPGNSGRKESACNVGDLGWSLGWEDPRRRERRPTPVFQPGEFQGLYSPWGHKESVMTEWLSLSFCHKDWIRQFYMVHTQCHCCFATPKPSLQDLALSWATSWEARLNPFNPRTLKNLPEVLIFYSQASVNIWLWPPWFSSLFLTN